MSSRVNHGNQNMKISNSAVGLWFYGYKYYWNLQKKKNQILILLVPSSLLVKIRGISTKTKKKGGKVWEKKKLLEMVQVYCSIFNFYKIWKWSSYGPKTANFIVFWATERRVPIRSSSDFFLQIPLVFVPINHNPTAEFEIFMFWFPWFTL